VNSPSQSERRERECDSHRPAVKPGFIKVCGITRLGDARHAMQQGATALGFVFWPKSPRAVSPETARDIIAALPHGLTPVGVFVNEPAARVREVMALTGIQTVQLHGDEAPEEFASLGCPLLKSVTLDRLPEAIRGWSGATTWLLDAADPIRRGGTGTAIDWERAAGVARHHQIVLAGGLTPLNVEEAIRTVRPFGVDVSSGVEASPGVKDFEKVSAFLATARRAFGAL
jgi:phosphoribosylanthranilate isomerase